MRNILVLIFTVFSLSMFDGAFAFSASGVNAAAVNTIKYNQSRNNNRYRKQQQAYPYVYSAQQARYYGIRTNTNMQNNQYQNRQNYSQNYSSNTRYNY